MSTDGRSEIPAISDQRFSSTAEYELRCVYSAALGTLLQLVQQLHAQHLTPQEFQILFASRQRTMDNSVRTILEEELERDVKSRTSPRTESRQGSIDSEL